MTPVHSAFRSFGSAALSTLLVCALTLAVSGCSREKPSREQVIERYSQELRETVSKNVSDERRKAQMLQIVDRLEALHRRFSRETADFIGSYRKLNADYDAPRPAFDQLFWGYSAQRVAARSEALDLHFEFTSLATADEWDKIGKAETRLYEKVGAARPAEGNAQ